MKRSDPARAAWLRHPHTQRLRKEAIHDSKQLLADLEGACEQTTDPKVAAAFARWVRNRVVLAALSPYQDDHKDEED